MKLNCLSVIPAVAVAAAVFLLAPPWALAVHDEAGQEQPPAAQPELPADPQGQPAEQQDPPADQPPPVQIKPDEPTFLPGGFYFGAAFDLGVTPNLSTDADFIVGADAASGPGFMVGYRASVFRLETELGFVNTNVGSLKLGAGSPFPVDNYAGAILSSNLMGNLYVDSPFALFGRVQPYVGYGYGYSVVHATYTPEDCFFGVCSPSGDDVVDDTDLVKSRQFMAGIAISSADPKMEYYFGYRRLTTASVEFKTVGNIGFAQEGLESQTLFIGFRLIR